MKSPHTNAQAISDANRAFAEQAERFDLRFRCDDCLHVVPSELSCSLGYPNSMLKGAIRAVDERGYYTFCKYFEL